MMLEIGHLKAGGFANSIAIKELPAIKYHLGKTLKIL